jgi:predicted membrane protein
LTSLLCRAAAQGRAHGKYDGAVRGRLGPTLGSVVLASLLICEVAAAMVGAQAVFFSSLVAAWIVLPAVVGPRNVLDAGCFYMLISLGIVVVVDVARYGPISLLA